MPGPVHRRLRQALRHDSDAQPDRFSHGRLAWPRRALRSHDHQRAPRRPNSPPHFTAQVLRARGKRTVVLPHAFGLQAIASG
jgi:hypothetical protein